MSDDTGRLDLRAVEASLKREMTHEIGMGGYRPSEIRKDIRALLAALRELRTSAQVVVEESGPASPPSNGAIEKLADVLVQVVDDV